MSKLREAVGEQQSGPARERIQQTPPQPNDDISADAHREQEQKSGDRNQCDKGEQVHAALDPQETHQKRALLPVGSIKFQQQVESGHNGEQIAEQTAAKARQGRLLGLAACVEIQDHEYPQRDLHRLTHEVNFSVVEVTTLANTKATVCSSVSANR